MKKLHISLFSGIGGFDVAAELAGWENVASCEINEFGNFILNEKWPNAYHHEDIHTFTFQKLDEELTKRRGKSWRTNDIVLTGGFPCQPYSTAGKRKGTEDERHLWPEMLRAIREIRPRWIVGENVLGIVNWNAGLVFEEVQADLEAEGYEVFAYVLPAASVNAPHQRYRTWFVAHSNLSDDGGRPKGNEGEGGKERDAIREPSKSGGLRGPSVYSDLFQCRHNREQNRKKDGLQEVDRKEVRTRQSFRTNTGSTPNTTRSGQPRELFCRSRQGKFRGQDCTTLTYTNNARPQRSKDKRKAGRERQERDKQPTRCVRDNWENFPTQSPVRTGDDGFRTDALRQRIRKDSMGILSEEEIDTIISKARNKWVKETIKAGGNAVVPPLVTNIFNTINKYDETRESAGMGSSCDECDKASGKGKIFF